MSRCRECGAEGEGNFCARCGTPLEGEERTCSECGAGIEPEDRYCAECGSPVEERPSKPLVAYLPWILSGLALVLFAVAITLFVQDQSSPRAEGMPPTGSVIQGGDGGDQGDAMAGGGSEAGMPSAGELAQMGAREAADRLFERTMREEETGDLERARFFAGMARRAYGRVPAAEWDLDAHFHLGLLALVEGDTAVARARADSILGSRPDHLLGHILAARAASSESARSEHLRRVRQAADSVDLSSRTEYEAHRRLIESVAEGG